MDNSTLENKKLQLEVEALETEKRRSRIRFIADLVQGMAILFGIIMALNEFVLKDRESRNERSKFTLELVERIHDPKITAARDSLEEYLDAVSTLSVDDPSADSLFSAIADRFKYTTAPLSGFYNSINAGVNSGFLDKNIVYAFLAADAEENIDILSELQSRHSGLMVKYRVPDYTRFRGLIEFYIQLRGQQNIDISSLPQYDRDKPAVKPVH